MVNKHQILLWFILAIAISGCVQESPNLFDVKSIELLDYVSTKSQLCTCILEPSNQSIIEIAKIERPSLDTILMKENMMKKLHIERMSTLDSMIALSKRFDLSKTLKDSSFTIISRFELDTITTHTAYKKWRDAIHIKCSEGLCYTNKPIFSPDFKSVVFDIDYGTGCLPRPTRMYHYVAGRWTCDDCDQF